MFDDRNMPVDGYVQKQGARRLSGWRLTNRFPSVGAGSAGGEGKGLTRYWA